MYTVVVRPFNAIARFLARVVDPRGIDGLVNGAARLVGLGGAGSATRSGYVRSYALVFLVGRDRGARLFGFVTMR